MSTVRCGLVGTLALLFAWLSAGCARATRNGDTVGSLLQEEYAQLEVGSDRSLAQLEGDAGIKYRVEGFGRYWPARCGAPMCSISGLFLLRLLYPGTSPTEGARNLSVSFDGQVVGHRLLIPAGGLELNACSPLVLARAVSDRCLTFRAKTDSVGVFGSGQDSLEVSIRAEASAEASQVVTLQLFASVVSLPPRAILTMSTKPDTATGSTIVELDSRRSVGVGSDIIRVVWRLHSLNSDGGSMPEFTSGDRVTRVRLAPGTYRVSLLVMDARLRSSTSERRLSVRGGEAIIEER